MKKKLFAILCTIVACLGLLFAFTACDSTGGGALKMEKKYFHEDNVKKDAAEQVYYLFHADGTGEYYYYYDSIYDGVTHYTMHFKYTYADSEKSAIVYFYDSVTYADDHTAEKSDKSYRRGLLTVSENVLASAGSSGYVFYVCEDYLKEIPNFDRAS